MMKTPFVAHPPSILVVHADAAVASGCKTAGNAMGIPVRRAATIEAAKRVVHETHPYVIAYDARFEGEALATIDSLAAQVDASLVPLRGDESQEALGSVLRSASEGAEQRRRASTAH